MTAKFLAYGGEMSRTRFWQEAALAAIPAILEQIPLIDAINDETGAKGEAVASDVARLAFEIAERMFISHGEPIDKDAE